MFRMYRKRPKKSGSESYVEDRDQTSSSLQEHLEILNMLTDLVKLKSLHLSVVVFQIFVLHSSQKQWLTEFQILNGFFGNVQDILAS